MAFLNVRSWWSPFRRTPRVDNREGAAAKNGSDEDGDVRRIRATTINMLLGTLVLSLVASMLTTGNAWGAAFLVGVALSGLGFVIGLLFSMPRALALGSPDITAHQPPKDGDAGSATEKSVSSRLYSINTNLEQVSDWLTKIIVGVGLVEAQRLADFVWNASTTLGGAFNQGQHSLDADTAAALALGMIIGFPLLGFLIGFFSVRLYISRAIYAADERVLRPAVLPNAAKAAVDKTFKEETDTPPRAGSAVDVTPRQVPQAVDTVLSTPIDRLQDASDLVTRGRAALLSGRFEEAATAFALALQFGGRDPEVLLDYARTLRRLKPVPWTKIIELLTEALSRLPGDSPNLRRQITWELLNAYLYIRPPIGFSNAIRLGEEFVATGPGSDDPNAFVYLAAAHGQAYTFAKRNEDLAAERSEVAKVREMIRSALYAAKKQDIEAAIRSWLKYLATTDTEDCDLKDVVDDNPDLAAELGLSDISER